MPCVSELTKLHLLRYVEVLASEHQFDMGSTARRYLEGIQVAKVILPKHLNVDAVQVRAREQVKKSVFGRGCV